MSKKSDNKISCRLGRVGGSALMEGVMMKSGNDIAMAVRRTDNGKITVRKKKHKSIKEKSAFLRIPIIRGIVNFVETLMLSMGTMTEATELLGIDEMESESKFDKWITEKLGDKLMKVISAIAVVLGVALALVLFMWLPSFISDLIFKVEDTDFHFASRCVDGVLKLLIFIGYIGLTSFIPDIKRVYMYHGAEHKSIDCYESGEELTVENVRKHTRFHPRCGTSFMFFMILLGIFAGLIIKTVLPGLHTVAYTLIRLLILPLLMGLGYEFIRYAGKHPSALTRALSAPGLWMQKITTKEPTDDMLEVAITSLKCSLRDDYPEFKEFYEARPWEPKTTEEAIEENESENSDTDTEISGD